MSFTLSIKNEILNQEFSKEQVVSLINGVLTTVSDSRNNTIIKMNNKDLLEKIKELMRIVNINYEVSQINKNWIIVKNHEYEQDLSKNPGYFFAGIFLSSGSISDPNSTSYHLEMQFFSSIFANRVRSFLNKYDFNFSLIQRRSKWILYLKKVEMISDFLKAIQAFNSMMVFEDVRINRDFNNNLNRYSNLDTYNIQRLVDTSTEFKQNYDFIIKNNLQNLFTKKQLDFYKLKYENMYSPLSDLVRLYTEKYNVKISKSALNHYLIKLRKIVDNNI